MKKTVYLKRNTHCQYCQASLASVQISRHQKFCSRRCKSDSQKRIVLLSCPNCEKEFSIKPYLKRNTNYCSRKCYRDATRKKQKRTCIICSKKFKIKRYLIKQGFGKFCSKKCQFTAYKRKRIEMVCNECGGKFSVPPSIGKKKKFCSKQCKDDYERDYVTKICQQCKNEFLIPRWEVKKGKGTFCSRECFRKFNGETSIENLMRQALETAGISFKQEVKVGIYHLDFLLPSIKVVIECDGDYWHSIPGAKRRDRRKDKLLTSKGYQIYRFSESEIKSSAESCIHKILHRR